MDTRTATDEFLDIALEQSFPASDPPASMAAAAVVGAPRRTRPLRHTDAGAERPSTSKASPRPFGRRSGDEQRLAPGYVRSDEIAL
jgi:hypothetical protein